MSILNNYKVSYAQNYEDIILEAFFGDKADGFYVDVGANHPERHSVTKIFYDKGWRGINLEPNPRLHALIEQARPEDTNLNIGIADKEGKLSLRLYHSRDGLEGLSTFSSAIKQGYTKAETADTQKFTDVEVPVRRLDSVLKQHAPKTINFMKVDVEGLEYEVLASNDWKKYRPQIICIEANHIVKDWHPILEKADYELAFHDGLNEYHLAKEASSLRGSFDYARAMLLEKPVINSDMAKVLDNVVSGNERMRRQLATVERELALSQRELAQVVNQRNSLYHQVEQFSRVRSQFKFLLISLRRALLRRAEKLNQPAHSHRVVHLRRRFSSADDKAKLVTIAERYDAKALKESRILSGKFRFAVYRVIKAADDVLIRGGKRILRWKRGRA